MGRRSMPRDLTTKATLRGSPYLMQVTLKGPSYRSLLDSIAGIHDGRVRGGSAVRAAPGAGAACLQGAAAGGGGALEPACHATTCLATAGGRCSAAPS